MHPEPDGPLFVQKLREVDFMEDKTSQDNFQLTVTMVVACNLLWWGAGMVVSSAVYPMMGGAAPVAKTAVDLLVAYAVSLLAVFPLIGRMLHIPMCSVWRGGRFDAKGLTRFVPAMYTFGTVGVYLLDMPLYFLLGRGKELSSLIPASSVFDRSGPLWCSAVLALCTVAVGPLAEEVFSRGFLLSALAPYGKGFAIIVSSLFFSLGHTSLIKVASTFLLGLVLGYVTLKTGSIKTSFVLHAINNGLVELCGMAGAISPAVGNRMYLFVYFALGACGVIVLVKHRRGILAELRAEPEPFVPTEHRTRRFLSNPLVLFFILLTAGLMARPFLQA